MKAKPAKSLLLVAVLCVGPRLWAEPPSGSAKAPESRFARAVERLKPEPGDCGLLLGFDTDTSGNAEGYGQFYDFEKLDTREVIANKTAYLVRRGGEVRLAVNLDFIASPQDKGFVYLGQARHVEAPRIKQREEGLGDYLFGFDYSRIWQADTRREVSAAKSRIVDQIKKAIDREFKQNGADSQDVVSYETLGFVTNGFYVATGYWSQITGGAAYFQARTHSSVVPLSGGKASGNLKDWYPAKAIEAAFEPVQQEVGVSRWDGEKIDFVEDSTFTLRRKEGRFHVIGLIEVDGNAHRSFHAEVDLGVAPQTMVKYDNPPFDFGKFKEADPAVLDVFISPNQNTVFVLTDKQIIGIDVPTRSEIFTLPHGLLFNNIVMAEWATGDTAVRWEKALQ